jgi:hypothetical protein
VAPKEAKGRPLADSVTLFLDREFEPRHVFLGGWPLGTDD